ncbi:DUF1304 family protein [Salinibacterium sp. ZJ450]|uniref:DUF1304 family protein n=1 Tax=Salinibacterium sp. ZJ450 TaxID=2708338 RepID=UPI00141E24C8|nr:DUF1304 family protein [Salinibacterium sp. ZJ450]
MNPVAQVLAVLVGVLVIGVGVLEAFFYRDQRFHSMFLIRPEVQRAVRLWVVNQGFYNMVLGAGAILGVILLQTTDPLIGRTLIFFVCAANVILGIVLVVSNRTLWRGAIAQSGLPLVTIIAALVGG